MYRLITPAIASLQEPCYALKIVVDFTMKVYAPSDLQLIRNLHG